MKITIQDLYLKRFSIHSKMYLTLYKNRSLLFINEQEKEDLIQTLDKLTKVPQKGFLRFIEAGIVEVKITNNEFKLPKNMADYIGTKTPQLSIQDNKLILSK